MATIFQFGNKEVIEPGSYTQTKSTTRNLPVEVDYGVVLLIDTGNFGSNWGGGSGINGTLLDGKSAINTFEDVEVMQQVLMGGQGFSIAEKLFLPDGFGTPGARKVKFIKAATTVPAELAYALTNGGFTIQPKNEGPGGNGVLDSLSGKLAKGYAIKMRAGAVDDSYIFDFYVGTFKGTDEYGIPYDNVLSKLTAPNLLVSSPSVKTLAELVSWFNTNSDFKTWFVLKTSTITGPDLAAPAGLAGVVSSTGGTLAAGTIYAKVTALNENGETIGSTQAQAVIADETTNKITWSWSAVTGAVKYRLYVSTSTGVFTSGYLETTGLNVIYLGSGVTAGSIPTTNTALVSATAGTITSGDLSSNLTLKLFTGGTETYGAQDLTDVLEAIADLDYNAILANDYGIDETNGATSANNVKLLGHIINDAKYQKYMYVGGGKDKNEFADSIAIANFYNTNKVQVIPGDYFKNVSIGGSKRFNSLHKAATVLGRIMGLKPQVPGTFKKISEIGEEVHKLSTKERVSALKNGLLITAYDEEFKAVTILQAINTLGAGKNEQLLNADGTSYEISVERIFAQLNKLLAVNAKIDLLGQKEGVNRNTLSAEEVRVYTIDFLQKRTATDIVDNLITYFENVQVKVVQDAYFISYSAEPNMPVNKLFFTNFALDRNLNPVSLNV